MDALLPIAIIVGLTAVGIVRRPSERRRAFAIGGVALVLGFFAVFSVAAPGLVRSTYIGTNPGGPSPAWLEGFDAARRNQDLFTTFILLAGLGLVVLASYRSVMPPVGPTNTDHSIRVITESAKDPS